MATRLLAIKLFSPLFFVLLCLATGCSHSSKKHSFIVAGPIRVVVWDERQKEQLHAYEGKHLGDTIADHLRTQPEFSVKSVGQEECHDAASFEKLLADCDVLIWWGHVRHDEITPEVGKMIVDRVKCGELGLIALHSAHWATPFVEAMNERTRLDAEKEYGSEPDKVVFEEVAAPPKGEIFKFMPKMREMRRTPYTEPRKFPDGTTKVRLFLPYCVFPAFREDGKPSTVFTLDPRHPIAAGLPTQFTIPQTEMYDEPFHVPEPDAVVFEERWATGEWFRSGCVWEIGKGKVFYFRPGHETYPVFRHPWTLKIIENATRWMGRGMRNPNP